MKLRKSLNAKILYKEIEVYTATMANFWNDQNNQMYQNSKQGIYCIANLMSYYMGIPLESTLNFARQKLNAFVLTDGNKTTTDKIKKEL